MGEDLLAFLPARTLRIADVGEGFGLVALPGSHSGAMEPDFSTTTAMAMATWICIWWRQQMRRLLLLK